MINIRKYSLFLLLILVVGQLSAQAAAEPQSTKIGAVLGVIVIIFVLIVLYVVRIEKKLTKLEKDRKV